MLPLCYEEDRQLLSSAFDSLGSTVMLLDELLSFELYPLAVEAADACVVKVC